MTRWKAIGFFLLAGASLAHPVSGQQEEKRGPPKPQSSVKEKGEDRKAERLLKAFQLWQQGYLYHLTGDYGNAIAHFRGSIEAHPTAEGHTFLGWSRSPSQPWGQPCASMDDRQACMPRRGPTGWP